MPFVFQGVLGAQNADRGELNQGFDFSAPLRGEGYALFGREHPQARNREITAEQDKRDPGGHGIVCHQGDPGGRDKDLVCDGIPEFPEVRQLIVFPGQVAIQPVGEACSDETEKGHRMVIRNGLDLRIEMRKRLVGKEDEKHRR